jgi:hypothetical protein
MDATLLYGAAALAASFVLRHFENIQPLGFGIFWTEPSTKLLLVTSSLRKSTDGLMSFFFSLFKVESSKSRRGLLCCFSFSPHLQPNAKGVESWRPVAILEYNLFGFTRSLLVDDDDVVFFIWTALYDTPECCL